MDKTTLMLRRTLLCAVLVCPLAVFRPGLALAAQAVWSLAPFGKTHPPRWYKGRETPLWLRVLPPLCAGLLLGLILLRLCREALPAPLARFGSPLCLLSGLLLQAYLILRRPKAGGRRAALCLLLLLIACTQ